MNSVTLRQPTSFRLNSKLLAILKERAKASNRSLNNYVESILFNAVSFEPNDALVSKKEFYEHVEKAISDIRNGKGYSMKPNESLDAFLDRMKDEGNV